MNKSTNSTCKTYLEYKNKSGQLSKLPVPEEFESLNSKINTALKQEELNNTIMNNKESMTNYYPYTKTTTDICALFLLLTLIGFVAYKSCFHRHYTRIINLITKIK